MIKQTKWVRPFKMGTAKSDDRADCMLSAPSWDCGWYWGIGYLGHKYAHFHLDGIKKEHNTNMFDAIKKEFGDTLTIKDDADLWTFCELMQTAYHLKQAAEVIGRGGSHYTNNPCKAIIQNKAEAKRINSTVLPSIFDAVEHLLSKYR